MLVDARTLPDGTRLDADLFIIGGGMAGIAIARELRGLRARIAILESGGQEPADELQALYRGSGTLRDAEDRTRNLDSYLHTSRVRAFGGSGHVWGGKCGRLDPSDFGRRDWIPESGWPFDRAHLDPFYDRASELLGLPSFRGDLVGNDPGRPLLRVDDRVLATVPRVHSPVSGARSRQDFDRYRDAAAHAPEVTVYLHANVTHIRTDAARQSISGLEVKCLDGRTHSAHARHYVLATGGMENARLLLLSTGANPGGSATITTWWGGFSAGT